jgi:1-acyl-sn-glycerol-3-phosphate acyltransferase
MLCSGVANISKILLTKLNHITFHGKDRWDQIFEERRQIEHNLGGSSKKRGLLSFSNHVSLFDDPLLVSNLGVSNYDEVRWIAADQKNFFGNNLKGIIYSGGKCVPIIRGGGLDQPGFDFLVQKLKMGDWVHIFPEGGRSREDAGQLQLPLKIGIGKLIHEAKPLLMPFYHFGMHAVLPIGSMIPKKGKRIHLRFGNAELADENWWQQRLGASVEKVDAMFAWQQATNWAERVLLELETQVHPLSVANKKKIL